jgi:hypothetical protein
MEIVPKIIALKPKDIYFNMEISLQEIAKLRLFLDMAQVNYDGRQPEMAEAVEYVTKEFYPFLTEVERDTGGA